MHIKFKSEYQSIKQFEPVELDDFTILTGKNGSGKTHLLRALKNGHVQIDTITTNEIVLFDFQQFKIDNEAQFNREQLAQERKNSWSFFTIQNTPSLGHLKQLVSDARNKNLNENQCDAVKLIAKQKNKSLLSVDKRDIDDEDLRNKFVKYKKDLRNILHNTAIKNNPYRQSIIALANKLDIFLDEIDQNMFMEKFVPINLKDDFLPTQIGKIFLDYRVKEYEEFHKLCDNGGNSCDVLKQQAIQKCRKMYGDSTPWEILNDFLNAYSMFEYAISFPKPVTTETYSYQSGLSFIPQLENATNDVTVNYNDLSSGEQILFALALCLFKVHSDNIFPKLLLLDEIDASLHPTMIENLFRVIEDVFLPKGTKVILVSHSPTTIALAPDNSIFVVNKNDNKKIEKRDKNSALSILTQGYATLDHGIKLFDQIGQKDISIITEGNNADYLKKALEIFSEYDSTNIEIINGVKGISGVNQLRTLFDFFTKVNHSHKVVFVFDSDYKGEPSDENNTFFYKFDKNKSNNITDRGIENLFSEELFDTFTTTTTDDGTGKLVIKKFNSKKKKIFLARVLSSTDKETFKNFKPFLEYLKSKVDTNG